MKENKPSRVLVNLIGVPSICVDDVDPNGPLGFEITESDHDPETAARDVACMKLDLSGAVKEADIVVPTINIQQTENENIIKVVKDKFKNVLYFSRSSIPFSFRKKKLFFQKHLSIISFKPTALKKYSKTRQTYLEKIEGIELMRALEVGLKIKSPDFKGDSFSVDVRKDYIKAKAKINKDKFFKIYKNY